MSTHTSDELYRRHEREWTAFRDAVKEQKSQEKEAERKKTEIAANDSDFEKKKSA